MTFEQPVTFSGDVTFMGQNAVFEQRIVFQAPNQKNWFMYMSGDILSIRRESMVMNIFTDGRIQASGQNYIWSNDTINLKSLASNNVSNQYLAYLDNDYQQQAFWIDRSGNQNACRVQITTAP